MSLLVKIVSLSENTRTLILATVADVRWVVQSQAMLLFIIDADGVAKLACRALVRTTGFVGANLPFNAPHFVYAAVRYTKACGFIASDGAIANLP